MSILGSRIKSLRESSNLNQKELAAILNVSNTTLSQYENGQRIPSDEVKIKLADHFNVTTDYLLGRTDDPNGEEDIVTIAAHHDGEEFSDEEKEMIEKFKDMVRKMKQKKGQ